MIIMTSQTLHVYVTLLIETYRSIPSLLVVTANFIRPQVSGYRCLHLLILRNKRLVYSYVPRTKDVWVFLLFVPATLRGCSSFSGYNKSS